MRKIGFIILALGFLSCETDPFEAGVKTNIQGVVYDSRNDLPIENLKIKVAEFKSRRGSIYQTYEFIQWLDSTYTDVDGYYNLDFETSGRGDHYELHAEREIDLWHYNSRVKDIYGIGKDININYDFLHLYPIRLVIEVNELDHTPISWNHRFNYYRKNIDVSSGTVERIIYTDKHSDTRIYFSRSPAPNEYESYTIYIPASNTSEMTTYNLTLNNFVFNPNE